LKEPEGYQVDAPQQLNSFVTVQFQLVMLHTSEKELPDDQHSCAREYWPATGHFRWVRCSDPQGTGRGRESITPAKMKLCLIVITLSRIAISTIACSVFLHVDDGRNSWDQICRNIAFEFHCSPEVVRGI